MLMCFDCVTVISVDVCCRYNNNNDGKIIWRKKNTIFINIILLRGKTPEARKELKRGC